MENKPKLMVFMIDAMCDCDVEIMRTLPNFRWVLENGAHVRHMLPIYPSFTYPCHTSIMTGCYPDKHGIPNNEIAKAGVHPVPWYTNRRDIKKKLFAEYAKDAGYSTCLINWPVSTGADVDINLPMCIPYHYEGSTPEDFYANGVGTPEVVERYFWKYGHLTRSMVQALDQSLDDFTNAIAPDIIRDYSQPDVMFVKMCDLDTVRHREGVHGPSIPAQLAKHDRELGVIIESVRRYGDFEHTNFVIMGDHGQTDVTRQMNFNRVLQDLGLQHVNADGSLASFEAYCHSVGASAWIELSRPDDKELHDRVYAMLCDIRDKGELGIDYVFTREETKEKYHLDGPFSFVIESKGPICFGWNFSAPLFTDVCPDDYKTSQGTHGGLPTREHCTTFFACGPAFKKGAVLDTACLVDEAPTMARILGFAMQDVDGRCMEELLNP